MGLPPGGTVTFLFTDIEGSTPLWDAHPAAMGAALARHDSIVRKAIDAADGHVFSTGGDGFGAVFARAGNAVSAAVAAQRALAAEPWPEAVSAAMTRHEAVAYALAHLPGAGADPMANARGFR